MDMSPTDCLDTKDILNGTPLSTECLGFTSSEHPHAPIFFRYSEGLSLAPSEPFNLDGHKATYALPTPGTGGYEECILAYCHAMVHAWKHNKGVPMNAAGDDLIAPSEWQPHVTTVGAYDESADENDDKPCHIIEIIDDRRSDSLITTATILGPNSASAVITKDALDEPSMPSSKTSY